MLQQKFISNVALSAKITTVKLKTITTKAEQRLLRQNAEMQANIASIIYVHYTTTNLAQNNWILWTLLFQSTCGLFRNRYSAYKDNSAQHYELTTPR